MSKSTKEMVYAESLIQSCVGWALCVLCVYRPGTSTP